MIGQQTKPGSPQWRSTFRAWGAVVMLIVSGAMWARCSAERKYQMLTFFFDGVPDPNAPVPEGWAPAQGGGLSVMASVHPPFAKDECVFCHDDPSRVQLDRNSGDICMTCHEGVDQQYPVMHGPVVTQGCLWCHNPHFSRNKLLLRETPSNLCMQCHDEGQLTVRYDSGSLVWPEHADLSRSCIECHSGHGGAGPGLLRTAMMPSKPRSGQSDATP